MSGLAKAIFGSDDAKRAAEQARQQQQTASIIQQRQQQSATDAQGTTNAALASLGRAPRGQRLLISNNDGGLANTLGGST